MYVQQLIEVDGALGLVLPPEVLARLQLGAGDTLSLIEAEDGIRLVKPAAAAAAEVVALPQDPLIP